MQGVVVIGAGNWGINLVRTLQRLGALRGIADVREEVRSRLAEQFPKIIIYADYRIALKTDIQAVVIATQVREHFPIAKAALLAGKDVFVEKPMTQNPAEAQELVRLAEAAGRILMVGHLLLYQPGIQLLKRELQSGRLGRLYSLHQTRVKLGRVRSVENVLGSFGVHDLAVLLDLIGDRPCRIETVGQSALQAGVEDDVYLHLTFPDGVQAHLHTSWLWPEQCRRLVAIASKGMLVYEEADQALYKYNKRVGPDLVALDGEAELLYRGAGQPLELECAHFLECVRTRNKPLSDGFSGFQVMEVLAAAGQALHG